MTIRERESIEAIPGVTMIVRTMRGIGATYEQFEPHSLDNGGAMVVFEGRVDLDVPLRVIVNTTELLAQRYAARYHRDLSQLKRNPDGSYQLFGHWLKVKWTRQLEDAQLDIMGCNKLLWEFYQRITENGSDPLKSRAKEMLQGNYTTNVEMVLLLKRITDEQEYPYDLNRDGIAKLARADADFNTKMLYCLLANFEYGDILRSIVSFKERYVHDPFQKRYGVLHGAMALNQGEENWENIFNILRSLADEALLEFT
ncbi:hypothetical protein WDW89_16065 [Deltaproteobacteria bacterium TL4]